jgi:hypothetical protein
MVVARSRALSAVSTFLAAWLDRNANTVRQQLREFCLVAWTVLPTGEQHAWRGEWLLLTDLAPSPSATYWYELREWIEQGFKITKRASWQ